jgi:hypothetical protein
MLITIALRMLIISVLLASDLKAQPTGNTVEGRLIKNPASIQACVSEEFSLLFEITIPNHLLDQITGAKGQLFFQVPQGFESLNNFTNNTFRWNGLSLSHSIDPANPLAFQVFGISCSSNQNVYQLSFFQRHSLVHPFRPGNYFFELFFRMENSVQFSSRIEIGVRKNPMYSKYL